MRRIHIMGASGVGTSTLGYELAKVLPHVQLDSDDYFGSINSLSNVRSMRD